VIAGLVNLLNNKVFYNNILGDEKYDTVQVPFYFSFTGDERYLQSHFLNWSSCQSEQFADGNYEKIPRGIVTMSDKSIDEGALTQRFIRGTYTKMVNGNLETFSANLNPIPLHFNFDVQLITDTMTDLSKLDQIILETFYKTQMFNVSFKGFLIACTVGFPDSYTNEKDFEYSYPDDGNEFKLSFGLSLDTYYPVIDALGVIPENKKFYIDNKDNLDYYSKGKESGPMYNEANDLENPNHNRVVEALTTERHASNRMTHIPINIEDVNLNKPNAYTQEKKLWFTRISNEFYGSPNFPYGSPDITMQSPIYFEWNNVEFVHKVDLLYNTKDDPDTWFYIKKGTRNDMMHKWDYHSETTFFETIQLTVIAETGSGAEIYGVINSLGQIVDVTVVKTGKNYQPYPKTYVEAEHELSNSEITIDNCGTAVGTPGLVEANLVPIVIGGKITDVEIRDPGNGYTPSSKVEIGFKIRSTSDSSLSDTYSNENGEQIFVEIT